MKILPMIAAAAFAMPAIGFAQMAPAGSASPDTMSPAMPQSTTPGATDTMATPSTQTTTPDRKAKKSRRGTIAAPLTTTDPAATTAPTDPSATVPSPVDPQATTPTAPPQR